MVVLFLKSMKGKVMTTGNDLCMIKKCIRKAAIGDASYRGLCLVCYGKAKAKVSSGETTWERLAEMGLCKHESNPFDDAYTKAMEGE